MNNVQNKLIMKYNLEKLFKNNDTIIYRNTKYLLKIKY